MSLTLKDRFHPHMRRQQQAAIDAGQLHQLAEMDLLGPEKLYLLARFSLYMLLIGGVFFIALNIAAYFLQTHTTSGSLNLWGIVLWIIINILGYIVILPIHELIHALAFALWGGKPYYGAKLPFVLYCSAKDQLFRRNHYLIMALAPLLVITLVGILFTLIAPALASYTLFATIGNVSGAAGDVWTAQSILRYPKSTLLEDTETGYRVWAFTDSEPEQPQGIAPTIIDEPGNMFDS